MKGRQIAVMMRMACRLRPSRRCLPRSTRRAPRPRSSHRRSAGRPTMRARRMPDHALVGAPSCLFDAVVLAMSEDGAAMLAHEAAARRLRARCLQPPEDHRPHRRGHGSRWRRPASPTRWTTVPLPSAGRRTSRHSSPRRRSIASGAASRSCGRPTSDNRLCERLRDAAIQLKAKTGLLRLRLAMTAAVPVRRGLRSGLTPPDAARPRPRACAASSSRRSSARSRRTPA